VSERYFASEGYQWTDADGKQWQVRPGAGGAVIEILYGPNRWHEPVAPVEVAAELLRLAPLAPLLSDSWEPDEAGLAVLPERVREWALHLYNEAQMGPAREKVVRDEAAIRIAELEAALAEAPGALDQLSTKVVEAIEATSDEYTSAEVVAALARYRAAKGETE
jgi:hypothetical protein